MISFGLFIEKKFLFSLCFICLNIPILKENSLNLLSSIIPIFVNREIFQVDPFAMFGFLSITGIVSSIFNSNNCFIANSSNIFNSSSFFLFLSIFSLISGLKLRNFKILKLTAVYFLSNLIYKRNFMDSVYFPFISLACSLSLAQLSQKYSHFRLESMFIQFSTLILFIIFIFNSFKSTELSAGGKASLHLNDLLITECTNCPGVIRAHVSKSLQTLGFSKFSTLKSSKIVYEFGTVYDDMEMIQKFKYRVADINENVDPAYWRVKSVFNGISTENNNDFHDKKDSNKLKLQVKLLVRPQAI